MRERTVPTGTAGSWSLPGAARRSPAPRTCPAGLFLAVALLAGLAAAATPGAVSADESDTAAAPAVAPRALSPKVVQQAYLKASNTGTGDIFGRAVAIFGDTMVIGAPSEDSAARGVNPAPGQDTAAESGAAYVYVRSGTTWRQQAYLKASNTGGRTAFREGDSFGYAVAISGNTIVIGAPDEDSKARGVNGDQSDNGAPFAGAAYVFVRSGTTWRQQAYLKASNTGKGDAFGRSVAVSGNTVVVGATFEASKARGVNGRQSDNTARESGAAYVFVRSGTTWRQQAYLKASNTGAGDKFGDAVAVSGDTIVVGADFEDSAATGINGNQANNAAADSGAAYVFIRSGTTWRQQAYLKASNTGGRDAAASPWGDRFGSAVAVSGSTIVVGAPSEDGDSRGVNGDQANDDAENAGAAYVFVRSGTTWRQQAYLKASNTGAGDQFGAVVAIAGNTIAVGASGEDSDSRGVNGEQANDDAEEAGAAYVFTRSGTTWRQQAYLKASNTGAGDSFGSAVATSGATLVAGALHEDSAATGVDGDQGDNDDTRDAGAAYAFVIDGTAPRVTAPVARVQTGVAVPMEGLPLRLTWTGSDPRGSGVDGYEIASKVAGGGWQPAVSLSAPRIGASIPPGQSWQFRVRAIDRAGHRSAWAVGPVFTAKLVEQTAAAVKYTGPWVTQVDATWYSGGSTRYTERRGASATYTFTGRSIALVSTLAPTQGRYRIFVDGRLNRTVDLFADTFTSKMIVWQKTWSTRAKHTVKIVAEGTSGRPWVDLDALVVLQ